MKERGSKEMKSWKLQPGTAKEGRKRQQIEEGLEASARHGRREEGKRKEKKSWKLQHDTAEEGRRKREQREKRLESPTRILHGTTKGKGRQEREGLEASARHDRKDEGKSKKGWNPRTARVLHGTAQPGAVPCQGSMIVKANFGLCLLAKRTEVESRIVPVGSSLFQPVLFVAAFVCAFVWLTMAGLGSAGPGSSSSAFPSGHICSLVLGFQRLVFVKCSYGVDTVSL